MSAAKAQTKPTELRQKPQQKPAERLLKEIREDAEARGRMWNYAKESRVPAGGE